MNRTLRTGSQGADVAGLQESLNDVGANPRLPLQRSALPALAEDGIFGLRTRTRVIEFQMKNGLSPDGIVGPMTLGTLIALGGFVPAGVSSGGPAGGIAQGGGRGAGGVAGTGAGRNAGALVPGPIASRGFQAGFGGRGGDAAGGSNGRGAGGGKIV
jgi:peptidoglycan hydrolase-like protein with peptidoglycan-binding domain